MTLQDISEIIGVVGIINEYHWDVEKKTVTWDVENYEDSRIKVVVDYKLVTRDEAMEITKIKNPRVRNYELEQELHRYHGIQYFIKDDCPINGFSIVPNYVN